LIIHRLLTPVFAMTPAPFVSCLEDNTDSLMTRLATYELDLAITDRPAPPHVKVRVYNHLLGASSTTMFATAKTAAKLRRGFPRSLDGASMLMPARGTAVRQSLDDWLDRSGIHPRPMADFEDSALMKAFGRETAAVFPAPTVIADDVCALYGVRPIGNVPGVREEYYVLSVERRLSHPAVLTMTNTARHKMFEI
jgi:LysR family transcriptional activator of nhaA